jgi:hypothetical protein
LRDSHFGNAGHAHLPRNQDPTRRGNAVTVDHLQNLSLKDGNMNDSLDFFDEEKLVSRLTRGLGRRPREVVLLVGSPLSAPLENNQPGVPNVAGIIGMIRDEFSDDPSEVKQFDFLVAQAGSRGYQAAFNFLQGTRGQSVANEIIQRAVLSGLTGPMAEAIVTDEDCRRLELTPNIWWLSPATSSIGQLVSQYPDLFGGTVLTTNFDPMIEVAIRKAGGQFYRTTLHADGDLYQTEAPGCHTIHLHGYWYGSDTLHTARQLVQQRPRLKASLTNLLRDKLVVVCGYGGWDDVFTSTLLDLVRDDSAGPEILWTFHSSTPQLPQSLQEQLGPGIARGRVSLYSEIDCNSVFPKVLAGWQAAKSPTQQDFRKPFQPIELSVSVQEELEKSKQKSRVLEGDDEDRPPLVGVCVGRESELKALANSDASVVFVTGIGGEGKSTLVAKYFETAQESRSFKFLVWRDCKEESERFENQLAQVIETLSGGVLRGADLAQQNVQSLIDTLLPRLTDGLSALFVFDNVDHYINLETEHLTGAADLFVRAILNSSTKCRVMFTCRPNVQYFDRNSLSIRLEGISVDAAKELFVKRGSNSTESEIKDAHSLTKGHAFWLDLLALQVIKRQPEIRLSALVEEIRRGKGELPTITLSSIWTTLDSRQQHILRAMAETVRPETEMELGEYLRTEMNYNKFGKALRSLRTLNLTVVKIGKNGQELMELHPLVRQFVRNSFTRIERGSIIEAIFRVYQRIMGVYRDQLSNRPSLLVLQRWTQGAELEIAAEKYSEAISILAQVASAFRASAFLREYVRVTRILLESFDWKTDHYLSYKGFDTVFRAHIEGLSHQGAFSEASELLADYENTVKEKNVRFIFYCEMRCSSAWHRGNFSEAVEWGRRGQELKAESNVDTTYNIAHTLALAERDAGASEIALPVFLEGRPLSDVIDPTELDEDRDGAYYGNVGRCLHFMGLTDAALICYQKSAVLIEKDQENEHVINQGYIRRWIGELLLARSEDYLGAIFLEAARLKWEIASPPRASQVEKLQEQLPPALMERVKRTDVKPESACREWIMGRVYLKQ